MIGKKNFQIFSSVEAYFAFLLSAIPIMPQLTQCSLQTPKVYRALLDCLALSSEHAEQLNARGFTDKEIKANGYKTLPVSRTGLIPQLLKKLGKKSSVLAGVPGFWRDGDEWQLAGKAGLAIPIRNTKGEIVSIKIRSSTPGAGGKYRPVSSNPKTQKKGDLPAYPGGTAAVNTLHYPLGVDKVIKTLRITEGELKADAAFSLTDIYTVGLPGVVSWRLALDAVHELKPQRVLLAFDVDKSRPNNEEGEIDASYGSFKKGDEPQEDQFAIGKAMANLYYALKDETGLEVAIEDWPPEAGKGIDDVLMNGAADQIRELTGKDADAMAAQFAALEDGLSAWVYVLGMKRFIHRETLLELDKEQFRDKFCSQHSGDIALKMLKNPAFTKVQFPIYSPGQPRLLTLDGVPFINLWKENPMTPKKGKVDLFLQHCAYLFPNPEEAGIVLDWLAFQVQHGGEKVHWALLIQGEQGTGKSYLGWVMQLVLGEHNVAVPPNESLHEVYTAWQRNCQLVIVEELMARGRLELMNKLKPMITEKMTTVREMYKPSYRQPNVFNFLLFTNHEDSVILDEKDRRYCVIHSPAEARDPSYYATLWAWTRENAPAVLHCLQSRDLRAFLPKGHAPMTSGKKSLIETSRSPMESWIKGRIDEETWPFTADLINVSHLIECLPPRFQASASVQSLGRVLRKLGAQEQRQVRFSNGRQVRVVSVRRHEIWASAEMETLATEIERWTGATQPGGHDREWNPVREAKPI